MGVQDIAAPSEAMEALAGIGRFAPLDARDREMWARLSAFCAEFGAEDPGAFGRDPGIGHVTASAFVLSAGLDAVLLTHHAKLNRWLQLGGHCDGIEDACFVATKEAYEESGLRRIRLLSPEVFDVDVHEIPASSKEQQHLHYDVRFLFVAEAGDPVASAESHALAWVPLSALSTEPESVAVLARKWPLWHARLGL